MPNLPDLHGPTVFGVFLAGMVASGALLALVPWLLSRLLGQPTGKLTASRIITKPEVSPEQLRAELIQRLEAMHFTCADDSPDGDIIAIRPLAPQVVEGQVVSTAESLPVSVRISFDSASPVAAARVTARIESTITFGQAEAEYLMGILHRLTREQDEQDRAVHEGDGRTWMMLWASLVFLGLATASLLTHDPSIAAGLILAAVHPAAYHVLLVRRARAERVVRRGTERKSGSSLVLFNALVFLFCVVAWLQRHVFPLP